MNLSTLVRSFSPLLRPENWLLWLTILILARSFFTYTQTYSGIPTDACLGYGEARPYDVYDYVCPVENLLSNGAWEPDYRLPGYSIIYLIFRSFLPMWYALFMMIVLQVIVGAIASYLIAKSAYMLTKSQTFFFIGIIAYGINKYTALYDGYLRTDSLNQSFLAISIYFIVRSIETIDHRPILYAGSLVAWASFMRPATLFVAPIYIVAVMA